MSFDKTFMVHGYIGPREIPTNAMATDDATIDGISQKRRYRTSVRRR
jgi:hypothetical protein